MDNPKRAAISQGMDADVIIAGGGLVGTALAVALARAGLRPVVVDPKTVETRADPEFDGRSYALAHASKRMLAALGLWSALEDKAQPILQIKASDGRLGERPAPFVLGFDFAEIEEGPMGFMVEDRHLRPVLLEALAAAEVPHLTGARILGHDSDGAGVTALRGQEPLRAPVLIAADGVGSPTAQRAGIRRTGWRYGQTSLVACLEHARPHEGVAHQLFLPQGPLAILPLKGNRSSIVWTERTERATAIQGLDDAGYLELLRPRFGDFLGNIALCGARYSYPLELSVAQSLIAPRLALVGDAAHRVHPIAGQGLNAGLKDVAALAETLAEAARRGEDIGSGMVLERYQHWRRFDTAALAAATDGFNRLFSNDIGPLRLARDIGLGVVNALPGLRRGLIREAAGLTGDLPRLLQGRAI